MSSHRRSSRDHDRHDRHDRRHSSSSRGGQWWVWLAVGVAVWAWGSSQDEGSSPPKTGTSTVCTATFKGGC